MNDHEWNAHLDAQERQAKRDHGGRPFWTQPGESVRYEDAAARLKPQHEGETLLEVLERIVRAASE